MIENCRMKDSPVEPIPSMVFVMDSKVGLGCHSVLENKIGPILKDSEFVRYEISRNFCVY